MAHITSVPASSGLEPVGSAATWSCFSTAKRAWRMLGDAEGSRDRKTCAAHRTGLPGAFGELADTRGHGCIHLMMWWGHFNGCMSSVNAHGILTRWVLLFHHFMRDEGGSERLSNFPKVALVINGRDEKSSPGLPSTHLLPGGLPIAFQPFSHSLAIF